MQEKGRHILKVADFAVAWNITWSGSRVYKIMAHCTTNNGCTFSSELNEKNLNVT